MECSFHKSVFAHKSTIMSACPSWEDFWSLNQEIKILKENADLQRKSNIFCVISFLSSYLHLTISKKNFSFFYGILLPPRSGCDGSSYRGIDRVMLPQVSLNKKLH